MAGTSTSLLPTMVDRGEGEHGALDELLQSLPDTTCERRTSCCALLPQMSFVEASRLLSVVQSMSVEQQASIGEKIVAYFLLNAARIMGCPFLETSDDGGACLVYPARPFVCRAYGLWSPGEYRRQTKSLRQGQDRVRAAWAGMGVNLPADVLDHRPGYCRKVVITSGEKVDDKVLAETGRAIKELDTRLTPQSLAFAQKYQSDLGFLIAAEAFGFETALKHKVAVVREYLAKGRSPDLHYLLQRFREQSDRNQGFLVG